MIPQPRMSDLRQVLEHAQRDDMATRSASLRDLMEQAQRSQPNTLKPRLGHDLVQAAETYREARAAMHTASESVQDAVRAAVADGMPVRRAAIITGTQRNTIYAWLKEGGENGC